MTTISIEKLNELPDSDFVKLLADIFEHSSWVADRALAGRPFNSIRGLHQVMVQQVSEASDREQLDLVCAHPDLAGKAALVGELTQASTAEQAGAGLDTLTAGEHTRFHELNDAYQSKFGFPFIIAVKGHDKHSILQAFETRMENDQAGEKLEALRQIAEIAKFRLEAMLTHEE